MPRLFAFLKDKQIVVARKAVMSGTDKFLASTVTGVKMNVQMLSDRDAQLIEGTFGKTYVFYCDGAVDVQEGDKLKDPDGAYYKVISGGVSRHQFGTFDHRKIIAERI